MIKVSELIGKPLLSLNSAEILGTVQNVIFDGKIQTAKLLQIYPDDDAQPEVCYIEFKRVKSMDLDACVTAGADVTFEWNTRAIGAVSPMNAECYNQDGKSFGRVRDIFLDGAQAVKIVTDGTELDPALVLTSGNVLFFNDTGKPVKLAPKKLSVPKPYGADGTVTVHTTEHAADADAQEDMPDVAQNKVLITAAQGEAQTAAAFKTDAEPVFTGGVQVNDAAVSLPARVPPENTLVSRTPQKDDRDTSAYAFLLNKTVARDIYADPSRLLAPAGAVVTDDIIRAARACGKLVQLALYAD